MNGSRKRQSARRSKLKEIEDWTSFAKSCGYRIKAIAEKLNLSSDWVAEFLKTKFGSSGISWGFCIG
jgi:hypothetical protein